jgi:predicted metalloprotease with PDZ domain/beta-lactamase regulating signal transducer with metallopeptidase domain
MTWLDAVISSLAGHPLLARLCFATLELLLASVLLAAVLRWRRVSSPRLVSFLWLIVLAKPIVTLAVGAPIAVVRLQAPTITAESTLQAFRSDDQEVSSPRESLANDLEWQSEAASAPVSQSLVQSSPPSEAASGTRWLWSRRVDPAQFILVPWLAGVAFFLARYLFVRWRLHRIVAAAVPVPAGLWRRHGEIARELGLSRLPGLRVTEALDSPALLGLVRPVILLPRWIVQSGWEATVEWALRHELCHCKWLDPLAILVRDVSVILFHFHPAAWWAGRRHVEAVEQACDRDSLRDPSEASAYAERLYEILLQIRDGRAASSRIGMLALVTRGRMARRMTALLDGKATRPLTPLASTGAALTALAVFAFGCAVDRPKPQPAVPQQAHEHSSSPDRRPSLFLFGPTVTEQFSQVSQAAWAGTVHVGNTWGRIHEVSIYDDLFENPSNPFRRGPGDLLVLLLTLEPGGQLPKKYEDLLPSPWPQIRARLERGETVEASGSARDMHVVALGAPTQAQLETLVLESKQLQRLIGSPLPPTDQRGHPDPGDVHDHAGTERIRDVIHAAAGPRPPDVFILGGADLAMFEKVMQNTSRGTFSKTGRDHSDAVYDEIFSPIPNHYDRSDGDLMVLLFTLEQGTRLPAKYEDLLPRSWSEIEAALHRGETVELAGRARGLEVVVLAAPTVDGLSRLIETTSELARYRPAGAGAGALRSVLPAGTRYLVRFDADDRRTASVRLAIPAGSGALLLAMCKGARHIEGGYAHFLRKVSARSGDGGEVSLEPDEAGRFRVDAGDKATTVEYQVALEHDASPWPEGGPDEAPYATSNDVFWTGRALFLSSELDGAEVEFHLPQGWRVSTPWEPVPGRPNTFRVADRQELVESFLLAGTHAQFQARSGDAQVLLAVGRDLENDGEGVRDAVQRVLGAGRELFGGTPPGRKLLIANLDPRASAGSLNGGVFGNSISLLTGRAFGRDGEVQWAPFVAHEVVHLWNGSAGFRSRDNDYWFSEGFTEYYAFVLCARLDLVGRDKFLDRVRAACRGYLTHAGSISLRDAGQQGRQVRAMQYDGGFVAALVLDLRLRERTNGSHGLDDLMREMFVRHGSTRRPYSLADIAAIAADLAGDDLDRFFDRYVAGIERLPLESELAAAGLQLHTETDGKFLDRNYAIHEVLRIRSLTETDGGLVVRRSADAGYEDGDRLVEVDGQAVRTFRDLQRVLADSTPGKSVSLRVVRDAGEVILPLVLGGREEAPVERLIEVRLEATTGGDRSHLDDILGK